MLFDGMKTARTDKNDVSCIDDLFLKIDLDQTMPFFYNNQFQFVVPVKRDAGKIQWNGTRISIVWKFCSCVLLGFVIILIIIDLQINLLLSEWFMDERQDRLT